MDEWTNERPSGDVMKSNWKCSRKLSFYDRAVPLVKKVRVWSFEGVLSMFLEDPERVRQGTLDPHAAGRCS